MATGKEASSMLQSLFNPENAFMCFMNKIIDLVLLSLVWLVCCIPIITIGPACAALYYAVVKAVRRQRSYPVREFWRAFKSNFKKGILFEGIWLILGGMMLCTDLPLVLTLLDTGKVQNVILLVLFAAKAILLLGTACWEVVTLSISSCAPSVWYSCKRYRLNLFSDDREVWIRDIHKFDEKYRDVYLDKLHWE